MVVSGILRAVVLVALYWRLVAADRRAAVLNDVLAQENVAIHLMQTAVGAVGPATPVAQVSLRTTVASGDIPSHTPGVVVTSNRLQIVKATKLVQERVITATGAQKVSTRAWRVKKNPGSAIFFVLPILGLIVALAAIFATILIEKGIPDNSNSPIINKIGNEMRLLRRPRQRAPVLPVAGALGRDAEQLLRGPAPFPPGPGQQPTQNPQIAMVPHQHSGVALGGISPEIQVVVPWVSPSGSLGIHLADDDLSITGFDSREARGFGFVIGDKILSLNGIPIIGQNDFLFHFHAARDRNIALGEPLIFKVWRPLHHNRFGHPRENCVETLADGNSLVGTWEYDDQVAGSTRYRYRIVPDLDGFRFGQKLPDGDLVSGILAPCSDKVMECKLVRQSGDIYGKVRLRPEGRDSLISNLAVSGNHEYGPDILSHRAPRSQAKSRWVC